MGVRGWFIGVTVTKTGGSAAGLKEEDYLSPAALEIMKPKYKSSFSEMQRKVTYTRRSTTKYDFAQSKKILFAALTEWFQNSVKFTDENSVKAGDRLAPVFEGVKEILTVTLATSTDDSVRFTFYNEGKYRLIWTTFALNKGIFFKNSVVFSMKQHHVSNLVHDRMSPLGVSNGFIISRAFGRNFKEFVKVFEAQAAKMEDKGKGKDK